MMRALAFAAAAFVLAACGSMPPAVAPSPEPAVAVSEPLAELVQLTTAAGTIHGTLLVPAGVPGGVPVALLIAGSGPTDRDGNSRYLPGPNDSLLMLAKGLAAEGIASLRYDKRGIGASAAAGASESDLRFDFYVDDAAAWIETLRRDPRFSTVTAVGHSEGSLIGMIAARRAAADGVISIAGSGRTVPEILREQLRPQLPSELWEESERILARLTAGETADSVPDALAMLYRPSVQPYLISWMAYEPAVEASRLEVPLLVIQGTTDIQITEVDAEALHAAAPRAELEVIPGMNHVLKRVGGDRAEQMGSYSDPSLPLAPELAPRIVRFIRDRVRLPSP